MPGLAASCDGLSAPPSCGVQMGGLAASCDGLYGARDGVACRERVWLHREMHFILRGRVAWRCRVSPPPAMVFILRADLVGVTTTGSYPASLATRIRLTIHPSPVTIHHSPFTCHHSPFTRLTLSVRIDSATGERVRAYACRLIPRWLPCAYASGIHRGRTPENMAPNPFGASYSALVPPNSSGALCMLDLPAHLLPQFYLCPRIHPAPFLWHNEGGKGGGGRRRKERGSVVKRAPHTISHFGREGLECPTFINRSAGRC
jgi:hypothetical protein